MTRATYCLPRCSNFFPIRPPSRRAAHRNYSACLQVMFGLATQPPRPCLHCQPLSAATLTLPWYKPWQQNPTAMLVCPWVLCCWVRTLEHEPSYHHAAVWRRFSCICPTSCLMFIIQLYERIGRVLDVLVLTNWVDTAGKNHQEL